MDPRQPRGRAATGGEQPALFAAAEPARVAPESEEQPFAPLAYRMRPRSLDELVGQEALTAPGTLLRRAIDADRVPSMVLWGPPGCGKTTLARLIAGATRARLVQLSAVAAGVADLRRAVAEARALRERRTILFIDEIHRFNRAQQDAILPYVEDGTVTLIGATTENPSFEVNAPLLSRSRVFVLQQLDAAAIGTLLRRALDDGDRGLGGMGLSVSEDAIDALARSAAGDARLALNTLDLAAADVGEGSAITVEGVAAALQHGAARYDRAGDQHYDAISAFIKSLRDSDPDGALYWMARMLEAGEDPLFIVRRMVILAAEDIGLADPQALSLAVSAQQAVHFIGLPEAVLPLSEAAIYLALAPKSNSALRAYAAAREAAQRTRNAPVPLHLRNAPTGLMRALGYGKGYRYAHDAPGEPLEQQHLPDELTGSRFYVPGAEGSARDRPAH
ncbi:MAG TPA: replication-associated recombination protein A [Dehalococcoidia bacterium]|nr:replication-associated recombination protein A [Dehalococcoidia bacterium]